MSTLHYIIEAMTHSGFVVASCGRVPEENVTMWDEIYAGRAYGIVAQRWGRSIFSGRGSPSRKNASPLRGRKLAGGGERGTGFYRKEQSG